MLVQLAKGLLTFVPGVYKALTNRMPHGTIDARYCYSVWLRHLIHLSKNCQLHEPQVLAELGPGNSLGTGLAGLLSGSERYYAFDVVRHSDLHTNLDVFEELVALYQARAPIPGPEEMPSVHPLLEDYSFPHWLLNKERLARTLAPQRLDKIRAALTASDQTDQMVQYKVPWFDHEVMEANSIDLVFSQAVMEHVSDPEMVYDAMFQWLKPGGVFSQTIGYGCHGSANTWNGHWRYSEGMWYLIVGKRPYLINRVPHSWHLDMMKKSGFRLVHETCRRKPSSFTHDKLAPKFKHMSEADLITNGSYLIAVK
jgi:Methyltransferase domain